MFSKTRIHAVISWIIVIWICKVFLSSLPYKFSGHPDTIHIFSTIGAWMSTTISFSFGEFFTQYGAILVGSAELTTSLLLLSPLFMLILSRMKGYKMPMIRAKIHAVGGLIASGIMAGAVFFHLATPLGIIVLHEGESDGGSLFLAAFSILILGVVLCGINIKLIKSK